MPLPPTQPIEPKAQRVIRMLPKVGQQELIAAPFLEFLQKELKHWKADLEERLKEGHYYLEWLFWLDLDAGDSSSTKPFKKLVRREIPALVRLIEEQTEELDHLETGQLFAIQRDYFQLCNRFDRIRLEVLDDMDLGGSFQIY